MTYEGYLAKAGSGNAFDKIKGRLAGYELVFLGDQLRASTLYIDAFTVYQAAADILQEDEPSRKSIYSMRMCVRGMKHSVKGLLESDVAVGVVQDHVIPAMREIHRHIDVAKLRDETFLNYNTVWCMHYIERCQGYTGAVQDREQTLKEALKCLKTRFHTDARIYDLYGFCMNNLGVVLISTNRPWQAERAFVEAIEAYEAAENLDNAEKRKCIENATARLAEVRALLKSKMECCAVVLGLSLCKSFFLSDFISTWNEIIFD